MDFETGDTFSVDALINAEAGGAFQGVVTHAKDDVNSVVFALAIYDNNKPYWERKDEGGDVTLKSDTAIEVDGSTWHFLAGRHPAGNMYIYDQGVQRATQVQVVDDLTNKGEAAEVGCFYAAHVACFTGYVDEVRVSQSGRTAAWVKGNYETGRDDLLDFGSLMLNYYVIFFHQAGGVFMVNGTTVTNGTAVSYANETAIQLQSLPDTETLFQRFTWDSSYNATNPYDYTIYIYEANITVWCLFTSPPEGDGVNAFPVGLMVGFMFVFILAPVIGVMLWKSRQSKRSRMILYE